MKFYACNEEMFICERFVTRNTKRTLFIISQLSTGKSGVSNSTSGDFCLILPVEV